MYKRISIRLVSTLSEELKAIARERGLSINALISDMAWDFVKDWKTRYEQRPSNPVEAGRITQPAAHRGATEREEVDR